MDITEIIEKKIDSIPKEARRALFSEELGENISTIGKECALTIDQEGILFDEVALFLLGETNPDEFGKKISSRLNLDDEKNQKIVTDVNKKILLPIHNEIIKTSEEKTGTENQVEKSDQEKTLDAIENPVPTKPTVSLIQAPERELATKTMTDNFIGQKMSPDTSMPQNSPEAPAPKKYSVDPYREPIQ